MVGRWDADDRNKDENLGKYLDALTRHQQQMIRGIKSKDVPFYLTLDETGFREQVDDSLTLNELSKLSPEEKKYRDKLIESVMAVWRAHKAIATDRDKNGDQIETYLDQQAGKGWAVKHADDIPPESLQRIYGVSEASRLPPMNNVTVRGILTGVQPIQKMIKGISIKCLKCNCLNFRNYDKPEFFESQQPVNMIRKCKICKKADFFDYVRVDSINALVAELVEIETKSHIDPLKIVVFGDDEPSFDRTRDIYKHMGEIIRVGGDIYPMGRKKTATSPKVNFLYAKYKVQYEAKTELELSSLDVKAVKSLPSLVGVDNVVNKLAGMVATPVIGHHFVKKGLLLSAASTSMDKKVRKIHVLLVGETGQAKTVFLREVVKVVPDSRYQNAEQSTGLSLTAVITHDEGDVYTLRVGPIAQAKGAIAALNEIGQIGNDGQGLMLNSMQEQEFNTRKWGREYVIDSPTALVLSCNPKGGTWKTKVHAETDDVKVDLDNIPIIKPLLDRIDFLFIFKDDRSEAASKKYAQEKFSKIMSPIADYTRYIQRHILYAKRYHPKPKISNKVLSILAQYYADTRKVYGSPRLLETIVRTAETIASLKLKDIVDEKDAEETIEFHNFLMSQLDMVLDSNSSASNEACRECLSILKGLFYPITYRDLVKRACEKNARVAEYIGKDLALRSNKCYRIVLNKIEAHSQVVRVGDNPIKLEWIHDQSNLSK